MARYSPPLGRLERWTLAAGRYKSHSKGDTIWPNEASMKVYLFDSKVLVSVTAICFTTTILNSYMCMYTYIYTQYIYIYTQYIYIYPWKLQPKIEELELAGTKMLLPVGTSSRKCNVCLQKDLGKSLLKSGVYLRHRVWFFASLAFLAMLISQGVMCQQYASHSSE